MQQLAIAVKRGSPTEGVKVASRKIRDTEMAEDKGKQVSELSFIECNSDNPFHLFKEWWDIVHHTDIIMPYKVCFSTASLNGHVSSRYVLVQEYDEDGFVVISDERSRKFKFMKENPLAAMVFMWTYVQHDRQYLRQVRVEGVVKELNKDCVQPIYDHQPPFCKIRAHLCHQDQEADWDDLKAKHDELVSRVERSDDLPMPDHVCGFKLHPHMMEFYFSATDTIADRLYFEKTDGVWLKKRLAA